jgi:hypothetical protein
MEVMALLTGLNLVESANPSLWSLFHGVVEVVLNSLEGVVIVDDCRWLQASLVVATIQHCLPEANEAAHVLVRYGTTSTFVGRDGLR